MLNNNPVCKYYQWETKQIQSRHNKLKVEKQQRWVDFFRGFKQSYREFIFHQCATLNQHRVRKCLSDKSNPLPVLNNNSLFCSIDYISNLSIKLRNNPVSSFTNQRQIACCELFEIIKTNIKLNRQSHCFVSACGDPKHDWQMSLHIIEKYIKSRKLYFQNQLRRRLRTCFCYSNRSPKEFSTTPLLQGLTGISQKNWGKWLHDAEGSVIKRVYTVHQRYFE